MQWMYSGYAAAEAAQRAIGMGESWAPRVAVGGALGRLGTSDLLPRIGAQAGRNPGSFGAAAGQAAPVLAPLIPGDDDQ